VRHTSPRNVVPMNDAHPPLSQSTWQRGATRAVALAVLCALLQALLPRYTLGTATPSTTDKGARLAVPRV